MDVASNNAYPTPFANTTILPLLLMSLAQQRIAPKTASRIKHEYDFIVVGAGSAGAVVASRLSEIPCVSVLLLEAGKSPPLLTDVPVVGRNFWFTDIDWAYKTVPQKHTGNALINKQVIWPSGKALGGSSILNGMLYVRGNKRNYDDWARNGAVGWSASDVWPYFLKLEDNREPDYLANGYHVVSGPLTIERPKYNPEFKEPIFEAAYDFGYKILDPNAFNQTGFYDIEAAMRKGQRCSTAKAYLVPAENRTNLDILANAFVRKVLIRNRRVVGVRFDYEGETYEVGVKKEVILSAGTTNSAQLLMLSGIGPKAHLEKFKIPVVSDLPVGSNFHDHSAFPFLFEIDPSISPIEKKVADPSNIMEYIQNRTGPLTSTEGVSVMAFLNGQPDPKIDFPNYELYFVELPLKLLPIQVGLKPEVYEKAFAPYENSTSFACYVQILQPRSRGTVRLNSSNPYDPPLIDPNYYADPDDIKDMVQGLKTCMDIGRSEPMQKIGTKPFSIPMPGCEQYSGDDDTYFECLVRAVAATVSHQVGTAKMGDPKDPTTVVDPQLRVKGIKGLRVVDGSIMPTVPSGNTNVPIIMIAEKASDYIKSTLNCYTQIPVEAN